MRDGFRDQVMEKNQIPRATTTDWGLRVGLGLARGIAPLVINPLWLPPILVLNAIGKRYNTVLPSSR